MSNANDRCCPEFHPEKWDEKMNKWDNKPFIKESIPTFFHIPFPPMINKKVVLMSKMIIESGKSYQNDEDVLLLFRDPSAFRSEIYFSVTGPVPNADNITLSGTFFSKIFSGAYNSIPEYIRITDKILADMGEKSMDYLIHYAYCPKCAKKYGNNYMILFAQLNS